MEKKAYKPVPDVECLKYHGTPEKPDIKIFVSHRIDLDSETIDNPLYIPVRCGAVYDERENVDMLGDDTGDNISEKRNSFCELTVLYWAWKNVKADYYGLCHYRRYISFAKKSFRPKNDKSGFLVTDKLSKSNLKKFSLQNIEVMKEEILQHDLITTPSENVYYAWDGKHSSMYELCKSRIRDFDMNGVDSFIKIIKEKYPDYSSDVDQYFEGHFAKYYNCFVMKKTVFDEFCSMLFDVLFELEKHLDTTHYGTWKMRMPGFMAENLFGIFYLHLLRSSRYKCCEKDLVYFSDTKSEPITDLLPAFKENNVPVVISSSNYFVPYASVFIKSVINNSASINNYDIIIFEHDITDDNKRLMKKMAEGYTNVSIRFYNAQPLLKNVDLFVNSANQSIVAYYRLLAPYILKHYDKAIVMDCDIVAKTDIAKLYAIDVKDYCMAAALDVVWQGWYNGDKEIQKYCKKILTLSNPYEYVNTGVVLFNLEKCRKTICKEELLKIAQSHKFIVQEQDVLNLVFDGKIKFIDIAWNMYAMVAPNIKDTIDSFAPIAAKRDYHDAHERPFLLHWAAQPKPWVFPEMDYGYEWWKVAIHTPFFGTIISRMVDTKLGQLHPAVYDLQCRAGIFDTRSGARKLADKLLPKGTRRREFAKKILPKGSIRWQFCKQIYYIFKPQYRPVKVKTDEDTEE
ncbi:DUF4422 domain-containing protein [Flintibacter faecis]|uniref:DUF4422 domain-containing protein n=1 Tax=Flintibacter faecis TaxID=2763047 RepID=A0A8J6IZL0_9FIRM|nr:DUF4422 domain-containing protein [Flintibacter faecis]